LDRNVVIENKWISLFEDKLTLPNGVDCTYYHVSKSDAVMVIALEIVGDDTFTYIVSQYRHPIGKTIWQFPLGGIGNNISNPTVAARNELREETGIVADDFSYMGSFYADPGFTDQKIHVCVTSNIVEVLNPALEATEFDLISKRVTIDSIESMIKSGEMGDAWGITGFHYLKEFLHRQITNA
jgi:ADP-ribose pyrophosphatase